LRSFALAATGSPLTTCPEELMAVKAAGADFAQGFHLGRPQPADFFRMQNLKKEVSIACL